MPAAETVTKPVTGTVTDKGTETKVTAPVDPLDSADGGALYQEYNEIGDLDLDKKSAKATVKEPEKAAEKPDADKDEGVTKPDDDLDAKEGDKDTDKDKVEGEKKVEPVKEKEGEPIRAKDLRSEYDKLKRTVKHDLEPKLKSYEEKIKELESRPTKDNELKVALEKLEVIEKRRAELEDEIRFVNYQKSTEFVDKYKKPFLEAWERANKDLSEIKIELEDGTTRPANANDLVLLANMPLGEARKQAEAMFGSSADDVMAHRRIVRELSEAQNRAIEDAQKNGAEREKSRSLERKQAEERTIKLWSETNEQLKAKYPKWFAPEEGDDEGNQLLTKGYKTVDKMFAPSEDNPAPQTAEEMVRLHALVRNKAANHDRMALRLKRAATRIKELETAIAEYEKSEPPAGKAGQAKAAEYSNWDDQVTAEINAMDKD